MRRTISWALLAIYLNASARLLLPWVSDCFAHLFFWHDHFEHVHHGHVHSHHVAAEMAVVAEDGHHEDSSSLPHPAVDSSKNVLSAHIAPELAPPQAGLPWTLPAAFATRFFTYQNVWGEVPCPPPDQGQFPITLLFG